MDWKNRKKSAWTLVKRAAVVHRRQKYRTALAATGEAPVQGGMVKNFLGSSRLDYQLFFRVARYDNNVKHVSIILDEPALLG